MRLAMPAFAPDTAADALRSRLGRPWPLAVLTTAIVLAVYAPTVARDLSWAGAATDGGELLTAFAQEQHKSVRKNCIRIEKMIFLQPADGFKSPSVTPLFAPEPVVDLFRPVHGNPHAQVDVRAGLQNIRNRLICLFR